MNYEITTRIKEEYVDDKKGFHLGLPMQIRIQLRNETPRDFFNALYHSAIEMSGKPHQDISYFFTYAKPQSSLDRLRKKPDTRVPTGLKANYLKLNIQESAVQDVFDMPVLIFEREIGPLETLMELTKQKL